MAESKIIDHPVEFKCTICGYSEVYPSPENVLVIPIIFPRSSKLLNCEVCNQIVCKQCTIDKKKNICKNCNKV